MRGAALRPGRRRVGGGVGGARGVPRRAPPVPHEVEDVVELLCAVGLVPEAVGEAQDIHLQGGRTALLNVNVKAGVSEAEGREQQGERSSEAGGGATPRAELKEVGARGLKNLAAAPGW